jgi:hypothetical protein
MAKSSGMQYKIVETSCWNKTLEKLSKSKHAIVVVSVAQNPKTPSNLLHNIFNKYYLQSQMCPTVNKIIISHKNIKNNDYIISSILGNPNKPQYILDKYFQTILVNPDFCLGLVKDTSLTTAYTERISFLVKFHTERLNISKGQEWDRHKIDGITTELLKTHTLQSKV